MRVIIFLMVAVLIISSCVSVKQEYEVETDEEVAAKYLGGVEMKTTSNAFENGGNIPSRYTCQGNDISPQLSWSDAPEGTKSFALIVDDPDAPAGTWVHWLVKDIPPNVFEIPEGTVVGNQVVNSFGKEEYGGPCPPSGTHRYFFKLYALDVETFDVPNKASFYTKIKDHKIAEAWLMGKYAKR